MAQELATRENTSQSDPTEVSDVFSVLLCCNTLTFLKNSF